MKVTMDTEVPKDNHGDTIHNAAARGDVAAVQHFVENVGVDVDCRVDSTSEWTPLHMACRSNQQNVVRYLVARNANVNYVAYNKTPLTGACHRGYVDLVYTLLELGADALYESPTRESALLVAMMTGNTKIMSVILDHCRCNPSIDCTFLLLHFKVRGRTLFQQAETEEVARMLVEQPRQEKRLTPLCYQMITATNSEGFTRLQEAREQMGTDNCLVRYLDSFEKYALTVPDDVDSFETHPLTAQNTVCKTNAKRRKVYGQIGVRMNPQLNAFQQAVAEETIGLILEMTNLPDNVVYGILGYLTPLDVMRRSDPQTTSLAACEIIMQPFWRTLFIDFAHMDDKELLTPGNIEF